MRVTRGDRNPRDHFQTGLNKLSAQAFVLYESVKLVAWSQYAEPNNKQTKKCLRVLDPSERSFCGCRFGTDGIRSMVERCEKTILSPTVHIDI
mmetsp:Transcript_5079/g.9239  ORF Transcript_5079/g.9239 Transcript_5079/m.9239 type:complete len:93 (+) Transcript_5079:320-598(+)